MLRLWIAAAAMVTFIVPAVAAQGNEADPYNRLPMQYWEYMDGYRYQYAENCVVGWHARTASFLVSDKCPDLSDEKLKSDAIKSIRYAQSKSSAKNFYWYYEEMEGRTNLYTIEKSREDARDLWARACVDAKAFKATPFAEMSKYYPGLSQLHAGRIFSNARATVKGLGGVVNCAEQAQYAIEIYAADIDIRARE